MAASKPTQPFNYSSSGDRYLMRIRKMPMLNVDEEYHLAKKWRDHGDRKAVDRLVESHLKLVAKLASGYRGYGLPLADLMSEGNIGMLQAIKHYDPERGFRFSTYAMWWIKASIQEYILKSWSLVKMGTTSAQKKLFFNLRKVQKNLDDYLIGDLSSDEVKKIATELSVREEDVVMMHGRLGGQDYSLNTPLKGDGESSAEWIDWLPDDRETHEHRLIHEDEMEKRRALLNDALASLTKRERDIFKARRIDDTPKTLEVLSHEFKISRERVRQVETKAFDKIRKAIKHNAIIMGTSL